MIDINWLIPNELIIQVWNNKYKTEQKEWKYVVNEKLSEPLDSDFIYVYSGKKLFDTIDKRIALKAWDILHLEYSINVEW